MTPAPHIHIGHVPGCVRCELHGACDRRIAELEDQLRTIAAHWPGKWTGYCCECDDERWPCQIVLDVVVPWMEPEEVDE